MEIRGSDTATHRHGWVPPLLRDPFWIAPFGAGTASIGSLLLYFNGTVPMWAGAIGLLLPVTVLAVATTVWAWRTRRHAIVDQLTGALWAGGIATLAYDVVRVPISQSGIPVFKAISYFGTVILGQPFPTLMSEVVGWAYHLSNGVGFAVMYAALIARPTWYTAIAWGCVLEGVMLLTPYAEVFGYQRSWMFLAITLSAHIVYGWVLWRCLLSWKTRGQSPLLRVSRRVRIGWVSPLVGIAMIAALANRVHAQKVAASAPAYIGSHLYSTWNIPELDRLLSLWILRKRIDPEATFHFVEPFSAIRYGTPFDVPNGEIRRIGNDSTTEVLLQRHGLASEPRMQVLAKIAHHYEISPWKIPSDPAARSFGRELDAIARPCNGSPKLSECVEKVFARLDAWYQMGPK